MVARRAVRFWPLVALLTLTACAPRSALVTAVSDFPARKYCEVPSPTTGAKVSDKALTKVFGIGCWMLDRQSFSFLSVQDAARLYRVFGGTVRDGQEVTGVSGLSLRSHTFSLDGLSITQLPDVHSDGDDYYFTGTIMRPLLRAPEALSADAQLNGAGPVILTDAGRRAEIGGAGVTVARDVYAALVERTLSSRDPRAHVSENLQGGALSPARHHVQTTLPPDSVVALVMRMKDTKIMGTTDPVYRFEVAVVQPSGGVDFSAGMGSHVRLKPGPDFVAARLHLRDSLDALRPAASDTPQDVQATLLLLSGVPFGSVGQRTVPPVSPESTAVGAAPRSP